jgi:DNA polymerase
MEPTGKGERGLSILAEGPGQTEDETGTQLVGKVGRRVRQALRALGVDLDNDCRKDNSVRCRVPGNETPKDEQVAACRSFVFEELKRAKPKVILAMGSPALYSLLGGRWVHDNNFKIGRWQGLAIPDYELNAWLVITYHPGYVERAEKNSPAVDIIWRRDLAKAISLLDTPLPPKLEPEVKILQGDQVGEYLLALWRRQKSGKARYRFENLKPGTPEWLRYWKDHPEHQNDMLRYQRGELPLPTAGVPIFMDYESDGLKPYRKDYRIYSCAIAEDPYTAYAWYWPGLSPKILALYRSIMVDPSIPKGGANIKFEHVVTRAKLGYEIQGWWWDTVNTAHVLDNRRGNSNVKFQTFTRLGIQDYDSHIQPFLKSDDPNGKNRIFELDPKDVLPYNGNDSCFEYAIALHQRKEMGYGV